MYERHSKAFVVLLAAFAVCGCGRRMVPVAGRVAWGDGSAYSKGGFVVIEGTIDGKPVMAKGAIAKDGSFSLSSRRPGDGVAPGIYRVRIVPSSGAVDEQGDPKVPFDKKFLDFETSGLVLEIGKSGEDLAIDLGKRP